jgi:hypothetical protein
LPSVACLPLDSTDRERFWRSLGAYGSDLDELLAYSAGKFNHAHLPSRYPLPDEPFIDAWQSYVERSRTLGVLACLREAMLQLRFPIQQGISQTDAYRAVTRRGRLSDLPSSAGPRLHTPDGLKLWLQQTPAGRIPVLQAAVREDFVALVQALTKRNEPVPVPASMGACIVSGYPNWGRIFELRREWEAAPSGTRSPPDWNGRLREIGRCPSLYQDRFILLSPGPYSATSAEQVGIEGSEWNRRSLLIRLEHECTHYFTSQVLGSMSNSLIDELIADYMGIVASEGRYRADWFLRFVGLENFPHYRAQGRLEIYRGEPPLSEGAFRVLRTAVLGAAENLEQVDARRLWQLGAGRPVDISVHKAHVIIALSRMGLETLAAPGAARRFEEALHLEAEAPFLPDVRAAAGPVPA